MICLVFQRTILAFAVLAAFSGSVSADENKAARGAYLARIMACADCHSPRGPNGAPMPEAGLIGGKVGFEFRRQVLSGARTSRPPMAGRDPGVRKKS